MAFQEKDMMFTKEVNRTEKFNCDSRGIPHLNKKIQKDRFARVLIAHCGMRFVVIIDVVDLLVVKTVCFVIPTIEEKKNCRWSS